MKVAGIIVEYNPFHNGHLYHLNKTKEITQADIVVAVMSGNFIQRGEPAIVNKWARTKMALLNGVDVVFELPFIYACNSAEIFAYGAVSILNELRVDYIVFGSEEGDIEPLNSVAQILAFEEDKFKMLLKNYLKKGHSFPKARELAIKSISDVDIHFTPNNILGIEYLKWLLRKSSKVQPFTIKRIESNYNDTRILRNQIASATAIRNNINDLELIKKVVPKASFDILVEEFTNGRGPVFMNDLFDLFVYRGIINKRFLDNQLDVKEGIQNRFYKNLLDYDNVKDFLLSIKSKRYTLTRLQRIFIHSLLDTQLNQQNILRLTPYIRVLGFNDKGKNYLNKIKDSVEYITKIDKRLLNNPFYKTQIELEIRASQLHALKYKNSCKYFKLEYQTNPIYISNSK